MGRASTATAAAARRAAARIRNTAARRRRRRAIARTRVRGRGRDLLRRRRSPARKRRQLQSRVRLELQLQARPAVVAGGGSTCPNCEHLRIVSSSIFQKRHRRRSYQLRATHTRAPDMTGCRLQPLPRSPTLQLNPGAAAASAALGLGRGAAIAGGAPRLPWLVVGGATAGDAAGSSASGSSLGLPSAGGSQRSPRRAASSLACDGAVSMAAGPQLTAPAVPATNSL